MDNCDNWVLSHSRSWNSFLAFQRCLQYILLDWNKVCALRIEVVMGNLEAGKCEILIKSQGFAFPYHVQNDSLLISCFNLRSSRAQLYASNGNNIALAEECDGVSKSSENAAPGLNSELILEVALLPKEHCEFVQNVHDYLKFLPELFNPQLKLIMSGLDENISSNLPMKIDGDESFLLINDAVLNCCERQNFSEDELVTVVTSTVKFPSSCQWDCSDSKLTMCLTSTPCNGCPVICVYIFGPFGIPIFNPHKTMLSSAFNDFVFWRSHGVSISDSDYEINKTDLLEPYCFKHLKFSKTTEASNLILLINFFLAETQMTLENKVKISQIFRSNVENILSLNSDNIQQSCKDVLEKALLKEKFAAIKRNNDMAVSNAVSSIFDVVVRSTNEVFRGTCLSLMNCVTTHGFKRDLHHALQKYSEQKQESKKRKRNEKSDWKLLEETLSLD